MGTKRSTRLTDAGITRIVLLLQATPIDRYAVVLRGDDVRCYTGLAPAVQHATRIGGSVRDDATGLSYGVRRCRELAIAADALALAESIRAGRGR